MKVHPLSDDDYGPMAVYPDRHVDDRGALTVVADYGVLNSVLPGLQGRPFRQLVTIETTRGVPRGLHVNMTGEQGKLVWSKKGWHWCVAVDVRKGSPTAGRHYGVWLADREGQQLWVPPGFAHGTVCETSKGELQYLSTTSYDPDNERSLSLNSLGVEAWPGVTDFSRANARDLATGTLEELWSSWNG